MQESLRNLKDTDPEFWTKLTSTNPRHLLPKTGEPVVEDEIPEEGEEDDSNVSLHAVVAATHKEKPSNGRSHARITIRDDGGLMSTGDAESFDVDDDVEQEVKAVE